MISKCGTEVVSSIKFISSHSSAQGICLPGTNEVIHLTNSYVDYNKRGEGIGSESHRQRLSILEDSGETTLVTCIVNKENLAQVKILEKNNWKFLHEFPSKDGETLILCCRDIGYLSYDPSQQGDKEEDI